MSTDAVVIVDPQQRFTLAGAPFEVLDAEAIITRIEHFNEVARSRRAGLLADSIHTPPDRAGTTNLRNVRPVQLHGQVG